MRIMSSMAIYLDDERLLDIEATDLGSVIESASCQLECAGRIVVEVKIDGESLIGEEVAKRSDDPVVDHEVRLYSANPKTLVLATLEQVREQLAEALKLQEQAAGKLQQDEPSEALKQLSQSIDIWLQLQQAVYQSSRLLGVNLDELELEQGSVPEMTDELVNRLKEMKDLVTNNDTVGLADMLAYEWPDIAKRWDCMIEKLIESVDAA